MNRHQILWCPEEYPAPICSCNFSTWFAFCHILLFSYNIGVSIPITSNYNYYEIHFRPISILGQTDFTFETMWVCFLKTANSDSSIIRICRCTYAYIRNEHTYVCIQLCECIMYYCHPFVLSKGQEH